MASGNLGVVVAWLVTYGAHSAVLLGTAWLITRRMVQSHQTRDLIWKVALAGGIVSATMQQVIAREPWAGRFEIARAEVSAAPAGIVQERVLPAPPRIRSSAPLGIVQEPRAPVRPTANLAISWAAVAFWAWLIIAGALVIHFLLRRVGLSARFGPREPVEDAVVLATVDRLREEADIRRAIRVTQAPNLASPVALGQSEICLPEAAIADLDPEQQLSMLAHEVAHLARRDPVWLMASCLLERLFFFQPLNHVARLRLQESAEYLCDDWAARRTGSGLTLAKCLVRVAEWIDTTPYPVPVSGMAEIRSQFVARIHRLIGNHGLKAEPRRRWLLPFSVAMVGVVVAAAPGARVSLAPEPQGQDGSPPRTVTKTHTDKETTTTTKTVTRTNTAGATKKVPETAASAASEEARSASWHHANVPRQWTTPTQWSRVTSGDIPVPQDTGIVSALLAALRDPDVEVRRAAAQSLGNLRSARAVPGLILALKDEDVQVRAEVLEALGNLRDQRAFDGILEGLKDPSPRIRAKAAEAVGDLLNESIARSRGDQAVAQLTQLLNDSTVDVRRHAIQALRNYERARPVDAFLGALKDPDKEVRQAAADALGQAEDPRALQPLILALADKSADVRHEAAHALGHLKDRRAADALAALVKDPSSDVRQAAVESLGELELSEAPPALFDALKDEDKDVRQQAAQAIGQMHDPKAVPALVQLLSDNSADVREQAVDALSEIRDQAAISALVKAMQSTDPNVRKRAAQALGERK